MSRIHLRGRWIYKTRMDIIDYYSEKCDRIRMPERAAVCGVILVGIYGLNRIYVFMDGVGIGLLIAGIIFLSFGLGIAIIEYIRKNRKS